MKRISNVKIQKWFIEKKALIEEERLFIFHHAGGGATYYTPILKSINDRTSVYIVQLPGREFRIKEEAYENLAILLEDLTKVLLPYLDKTFMFFGHSMGAMIAYELTCKLKKMYGIVPKQLFLSSFAAPHIESSKYSNLSDEQLLKEILDFGGTDKSISYDRKLMSLVLCIIRKDLCICDNYKSKNNEKLNVPVSILGGTEDNVVSIEDLLEWEDYFNGKFDVYLFEGNHFYFKESFQKLASVIDK